jgi:hypothetical protein
LKYLRDESFALPEQSHQEVLRLDLLVLMLLGKSLGFLQGFLGFQGEFVKAHLSSSLINKISNDSSPNGFQQALYGMACL